MTIACSFYQRLAAAFAEMTGACTSGAGGVLFAAGLLVSGPEVARAEPVSIVSFEIGRGVQTEDGGGFYARALGSVLARSGQDYTFTILPLQRAFRSFETKAADCIWAIDVGFLRQAGIVQGELIESASLFTSELHFFMPPGVPAITDLRQLEGRTVGVSIGSPVPTVLDGLAIDYAHVRTQDIKVGMLQRHRLDAIAGWMPDILVAFQNAGIAPTAYNPTLPIAKSEVGLVCWPAPATRSFLHAIAPRIEAFKQSHILLDILREFGIEPPPDSYLRKND